MLTGLDVSTAESSHIFDTTPSAKVETRAIGGWSGYIQKYRRTGPINIKEQTTFLNMSHMLVLPIDRRIQICPAIKVVCSFMLTGPVLWYFWMYPDQPLIERVSTFALGVVSNMWLLSAVDTSRPVSISTSARVGEAGPWPKTKALSVSD